MVGRDGEDDEELDLDLGTSFQAFVESNTSKKKVS